MVTTRNAVATDYGRIAAMFGLISAVLIALSIIITFASGAPPALDDPADKILNYYQDNEGLVKLGGIVGMLSLLAVPIWYLGVYSALRDRGTTAGDSWPRLGLAALIASGAVIGVQGAVVLALGLGAKDEFDQAPAVAGALFDVYNGLSAAIAVLFGLLLIATGVALNRAGGYPNWWSSMLYIGGIASIISFLAPFTNADFLAYFALVAIITFIVFAAASSMAMMRGVTTAPRTPTM